MKNDSNRFSRTLLAWYRDNKRELPWRDTRDPYLIWVSEIILQQTPLKDILGMLERKYDVDFQVDNDELYGNTFSGGAISMNGLEYVLETLEISSGIQWQYAGFQGYDTNPRMTVRIY